jgi:hypothetical protein
MNVLVIPEDFRKDQYMLKPIVAAMLNWIGVAARVEVCQDPLLGGVTEALKWERIKDIIEQYSWKVQLFLLCVDRDSDAHRRSALDSLEQKAAQVLPVSKRLLAENAWQEIEVWVLAGHDLPNQWEWTAIRAERDAKETYYLPFARSRGMLDTPGEGRRRLAKEAAQRYSRVRQLCPEDVGMLEVRIRAQLAREPTAT